MPQVTQISPPSCHEESLVGSRANKHFRFLKSGGTLEQLGLDKKPFGLIGSKLLARSLALLKEPSDRPLLPHARHHLGRMELSSISRPPVGHFEILRSSRATGHGSFHRFVGGKTKRKEKREKSRDFSSSELFIRRTGLGLSVGISISSTTTSSSSSSSPSSCCSLFFILALYRLSQSK